jgi:MFS family permease
VLLLLYAVLAWQSRTAGVTHSNDDALYALLGRSLEHFSYRESFRIGAPLHGQYPPVWPALIALADFASGHGEGAAFAVATLLMTAALLLFFDVARRFLPAGLALGLLAAAALNPYEVAYGGRLMSEAAYWFWSSLTLWAVLRSRGDQRLLLLAGTAALMAAFTRSIGVTLILAVLVTWALGHRWRAVGWLAGFSVILVGGWIFYTVKTHEDVVGRSYMADAGHFVERLAGDGVQKSEIVKVLANRMREQVVGVIPAMMPLPRFKGTVADNLLWLVVAVVFGLAGALALRRRFPVLMLYLVFYYGLLMVWPFAPRRFFIPIQPLVLLVLVLGAVSLVGRRGRLVGWGAAAGVLCAVLAVAVPHTLQAAREMRQCDRDHPWTSSYCYDADQRSFFAAVTFARDSLPPDARFLVEREASFAYHAKRLVEHAQVATRLAAPEFVRFLTDHRIEYIVVTRLINVELQTMAPKLQEVCTRLELVRHFPPYGRLYRLLPSEVAAEQNACADLNYFIATTPLRPVPR